jgi:hypothetical protein
MWLECKRCQRKIFSVKGRSQPHEGYCADCYEIVTGKCADCSGTGLLDRAHLGTMECARCEGTGQAPKTETPE